MADHPELVAALREAAKQEAATTWEAVKNRVRELEDRAGRETDAARARTREEIARYARSAREAAITAGEREATAIRMAAGVAVAERARELAARSLGRLRQENYPALFADLASEIPPGPWASLRVNAEDRELAQARFPEAKVLVDDSITGGIEVESGDGRIRISNTFETRLERAWPQIVTDLVRDLWEDTEHHQPAA